MGTHDLSSAVWRVSSYSGANGACIEVALIPGWKASSYSGTNGACIEVATSVPGVVAVRDSKDRPGPVLSFTPSAWARFTAEVRAGRFGSA